MKPKTRSAGLPVKTTPQNTSNDTTVNTNFISTLEQDGDDLIMNLPDELDWKEGDVVEFKVINSVITITKINE
tara:strand:- start:4331 stop:4549 length:219 start_codon:yes stop_codon:yes gene_type:complete